MHLKYGESYFQNQSKSFSTLSNAIQIYTSNETDSPLAHSNQVISGMNKISKFQISGQLTNSSLTQTKYTSAKSVDKSEIHD